MTRNYLLKNPSQKRAICDKTLNILQARYEWIFDKYTGLPVSYWTVFHN